MKMKSKTTTGQLASVGISSKRKPINEYAELLKLPKNCKICGESSEYAKMYGCPVGYTGKDKLPKCPHGRKKKTAPKGKTKINGKLVKTSFK